MNRLALPFAFLLLLLAAGCEPSAEDHRQVSQKGDDPGTEYLPPSHMWGNEHPDEDDQRPRALLVSDTNADAKFARDAAMANLQEIELGRIAMKSAGRKDVRLYGQRIVDERTLAQSDLKELGRKRGLVVPTELDALRRQRIDRLSGLSGEEFDRDYMNTTAKHQDRVIALFERAADDGYDDGVRTYATKNLPILRDSWRSATELNRVVDRP